MNNYKEMYYTAQKTFCEHNNRVLKEFADRLKGKGYLIPSTMKFVVDVEDIDKILKEFGTPKGIKEKQND